MCIRDSLDIINEENEEQAILIGHDWGAPICWTTAALHPEKVRAVVGLSVPHSRRGNISNSELWRQIYKDNFFYQTYFEKEGVAEAELERDVGASLRKIYYWISAEGHDAKVRTNFDKDSELLDGLVDPEPFPNWLTEEDLNFYIKEFKNSGFRGPINRYRNQGILPWHLHPMSAFSGTFAINDAGMLSFKDPVQFRMFESTIPLSNQAKQYDVPTKPGQCIIFPWWMEHGALNLEPVDRWSISFNSMPYGKVNMDSIKPMQENVPEDMMDEFPDVPNLSSATLEIK